MHLVTERGFRFFSIITIVIQLEMVRLPPSLKLKSKIVHIKAQNKQKENSLKGGNHLQKWVAISENRYFFLFYFFGLCDLQLLYCLFVIFHTTHVNNDVNCFFETIFTFINFTVKNSLSNRCSRALLTSGIWSQNNIIFRSS